MSNLEKNNAEWYTPHNAIAADAHAAEIDDEEVRHELENLNNPDVKLTDAEADAELENIAAALAEEEKEEGGSIQAGVQEEEEEELDELNNDEGELPPEDVDAQMAELEAEAEKYNPRDAVIDAITAVAPPGGALAVANAPAEPRGWWHRLTGFSTNRIPGWERMRKWTGFGGRTRRRRRNTRKKRSRRRKRNTRKKRKTRKPRRKRKTRRKRRRRRRR